MGHYELISACFFGKLALKKHFFEVHTPKFADPSPTIVHIMCEIFCHFFGGFPLISSKYLILQKFEIVSMSRWAHEQCITACMCVWCGWWRLQAANLSVCHFFWIDSTEIRNFYNILTLILQFLRCVNMHIRLLQTIETHKKSKKGGRDQEK